MSPVGREKVSKRSPFRLVAARDHEPPLTGDSANSDILQVISGKETKLKGTKKDPNCGFCQNHGVKILRKGE